jgi:Bacteriophage HK97-gp10, putative tail-component
MARGGLIIGFGDKGIEKAVNKFERHIIKQVKRIVAETAVKAQAQMIALAPTGKIDGGNLKESIEVQYFNRGLSAQIKVNAFYGIWVEYGTGIYSTIGNGKKTPWVYFSEELDQWVFTRGMEASPFFYPGLEVAFKHFKDEMNKLG